MGMEAWAVVVAAVAGAAIALLGQWVAKRGERKTRAAELLLEQCALLVALNEDFRNRIWEERTLQQAGRADGWDLGAARLTSARIRTLCDDADVLAALDEIGIAGKELGAYWRRGDIDEEEFERRYEREKTATARFLDAAAGVIRSGRYGL
jgi:hypothetical protein